MNIELIKIPESTTDLFQALDCRIFGVLKNMARKFFNTHVARELVENLSIDEILHQSVALPQIKTVSKIFWKEVDENLLKMHGSIQS